MVSIPGWRTKTHTLCGAARKKFLWLLGGGGGGGGQLGSLEWSYIHCSFKTDNQQEPIV